MFSAYNIPVYIVFDNDPSDDSNAKKRIDALLSFGVKKSDKFISIEDWKVGNNICIMGVDFETTLRKHFDEYTNFEKIAINNSISSKPFIARFVAENLTFNKDEKGWQKIIEMTEKLKDKLENN